MIVSSVFAERVGLGLDEGDQDDQERTAFPNGFVPAHGFMLSTSQCTGDSKST